jgi:hypothetical protein
VDLFSIIVSCPWPILAALLKKGTSIYSGIGFQPPGFLVVRRNDCRASRSFSAWVSIEK